MAEITSQQCGFSNDDFLASVDNSEEAGVDVRSDDVELVENTSIFTGSVEVLRGGQELTADRASYNKLSGDIIAEGNVQIRDNDMILNSNMAEWSLTKDEGTVTDAKYRLREGHIRGEAESIFRAGIEKTKIKNGTYTTCAPGDNAWVLKSEKVDLDHVEAVGVARDVVVKVAGVPVFYSPYLSFPLNDERKSGFLTPSVGLSDDNGFQLAMPYYWNISPNKDATITPRYMSERGLMLEGQFRYLESKHQGQIDAGFLASDNQKNSRGTDNPFFNEDRKHFSIQHASYFTSRLRANIDYSYVSDISYLEDFGNNLSLASTTHLNRLLNVGYYADNWKLTGRLQGYQTVTNAAEPYQRLPQIQFQGAWPEQAFGLSYKMQAEYVDFDHDELVHGQRFDLEPSVSLPLRSNSGFITPRLALHHTQYKLDGNGVSLPDNSPSRTLPVSSIDSGLFFERETTLFNSDYAQTLEPRAFYLHIPERNQDDIPIFDTGLRTFSMGRIFSHDRFTGSDRVGDTNQLSLALTTRFINKQTGREKFRATLGQIQYFSDRKVSLNGAPVETESDSDMVAEIAASIAKEWTLRGEMQWDPSSNRSNNMSAIALNYRGDKGHIFNVSHRYRRDDLEQFDVSARIPLNKQWSIIGRWYHSMKDNRTLEGLAGIEYDSCCWATRLVLRDYVNNSFDEQRNMAIFFQVELKGLGNFGQNSQSLLERSILGYGS